MQLAVLPKRLRTRVFASFFRVCSSTTGQFKHTKERIACTTARREPNKISVRVNTRTHEGRREAEKKPKQGQVTILSRDVGTPKRLVPQVDLILSVWALDAIAGPSGAATAHLTYWCRQDAAITANMQCIRGFGSKPVSEA